MLDLLDPDEVRANIGLFVDFARPDSGRQEDLRASYFACLNKVQERCFRIPEDHSGPFLDFDIFQPVNLPTAQYFLKKNVVAETSAASTSLG